MQELCFRANSMVSLIKLSCSNNVSCLFPIFLNFVKSIFMQRVGLIIFTLAAGIIFCSFLFKTSPEKYLKKQGFRFISLSNENKEEGFFIFETEISNDTYKYFLNDLKSKGRTDDYEIARVDSSGWEIAFNDFAPYTNFYFQHESYDQYPVVNISYEGAVLYCKWLTEIYKSEGYDITVSLPDSIQWKTAAKGGNAENIYSWEGTANVNKKGFYKCNAKKEEECSYVTAPVYSFEKNNFGLYNTCGNVAEMLKEKGSHKGGSWNSSLNYVKLDSKDEYAGISEPSPYIGFRPVAIINN